VTAAPDDIGRATVPPLPGRQVEAAIRVLLEFDVVRAAPAAASCWIRLIASPERIAALAATPTPAVPRESQRQAIIPASPHPDSLLLAALPDILGPAAYRGRELDSFEKRRLAHSAGAAKLPVKILDDLRQRGFLDWRRGGGSAYSLLGTWKAHALPVDWVGLMERRRRDETRIRRMERYATHRGCRRGYLLSYFGDRPPAPPCGACDACGEVWTLAASGRSGLGRVMREER
jgi:ATP-dependent DNA helicase RecQ